MNDVLQLAVEMVDGGGVPRWVVMWSMAGTMFLVAKGLTLWEAGRQRRHLAPGRTAAYLLLWVGMDVRGFLSRGGVCTNWGWAEASPGVLKTVCGALLLWGIAPLLEGLAAGWAGMTGMVLMLHFGLFHLLAVFWARGGWSVEPIMKRPLCARTLAEFWGERWNRAFNELMVRFVFQPARRWMDARWALLVTFVVSGLIHEAIISGPAAGGFGGPSIYFLVQGIGLLAQRTRAMRRRGFASGWKGRLFTGLILLLPLPLLFHAPFIEGVILPFMEEIGVGRMGG